jgi:SAM-dependent methyltransferase
MNNKKDAYGQEIWAYFQGENSCEIVERDDGFINLSEGAPAYFAQFKDWLKIEKQAIKFAKGRVLDIGAGAGRVPIYLQKRGFDVTAIDNSPLAIKVCKERGVKKAKILPIEKIGVFKPNTFDTIIMFGNNFGLFGSFQKARALLKKLYKITNPHALILAESNNIYQTTDPDHLFYHKFNKKRGRMPGQLRLKIRFKKYKSAWFDYLLVSPKEMRKILENTGWKIKKFIYSSQSTYLAIIEKGNSH